MDRRLQQKNDHPGYSCERAPWALVTGVGPFQLNSANTVVPFLQGVKRRFWAILALEHTIDERVYKLYGLTEKEIAIVEGTTQTKEGRK